MRLRRAMLSRRFALGRLAFLVTATVLTVACVEESNGEARSGTTTRDGTRMQSPAGDTRGGGDMPGKGRAGEHKLGRWK